MTTRVLFVCLGNICRSPTAEAVFRELVRRSTPALDVEIDSAGTHAYHTGAPPDRRTAQTALRRGIDMGGLRARVVEVADFHHYDLLLAMDEDNLRHLQAMAPAGSKAKLSLFLEFAQGESRREVPDPYYGGETGFEDVLDLVEAAAEGLLASLRG